MVASQAPPAAVVFDARGRRRGGRRKTPILAVTADTDVERRDDRLGAGCDAYLGKPFSQSDLFRVIGGFLGAGEAPKPLADAVPEGRPR